MRGFIHTKRKDQKDKSAKKQEYVFKWVPVKGIRLSSDDNRNVYEEYKQVRSQLLKDTVYNPDGSENKEGISRLRQAGISDKDIFKFVAQGQTPIGYNYHHLFPRALSGSFEQGSVQLGDESVSSIHDWRCLQPLPNSKSNDIHKRVHDAMDERNGTMDYRPGQKVTYYIAMPLTADEYQQYKQNPKSVKAELLVVTANSFKTIDQRGNSDDKGKSLSMAEIAKIKMAKAR